MDKRSPDDIRKSIKSLVEEAENVSIEDKVQDNDLAKNDSLKSKLEPPPAKLEDKYKPDNKNKPHTEEKDLDLTGLISDDVALAVRAELMRYSDVFDTDDTKDIIYRSVTNATREMVREWLDQNLATIAKEVINEALDKLSKNARN